MTEPTDNGRIAIALRFYLERCAWGRGDTERAEFERLVDEYEARAETDARLEARRARRETTA